MSASDPMSASDSEDGSPFLVADWGEWEGETRDGMANGTGNMTFSNGFRYEGQVRDNMMHGRGRLVFGETGEEY